MNRNKRFIIPAIDIIDGKCVRLTNGDYAQQKMYYSNPVDAAKFFEAAGFSRLHIVDLDGAKAGKICNFEILEKIAAVTKLEIDFGGGIKLISDVKRIFESGVSIITIGSLAVRSPAVVGEWVATFGTDKFLIGADVLDEKIKINGWLADGGIDLYDFLTKIQLVGVRNIFCTDIALDGVMLGPSFSLYKAILSRYPELNLIASGGVRNISEVNALKDIGCSGVIIGKALYEGAINLQEL